MENEIIYLLRQAILSAVSDAFGPTSFERTMRHAELCNVETAAALGQWRELLRFGYLEPLTGSGGKYVRLSERGRAGAEQRTDPFIWGVIALR